MNDKRENITIKCIINHKGKLQLVNIAGKLPAKNNGTHSWGRQRHIRDLKVTEVNGRWKTGQA